MKVTNLLFVIFALLSCSISTNTNLISIMDDIEQTPVKEAFKVFHFMHEKEYDLNSEEGLRRYKIFTKNFNWVNQQNSYLGKKLFGVTPFLDLTEEEFHSKYSNPELMKEKFEENNSESSGFLSESNDSHHDHHPDDHHDDHHHDDHHHDHQHLEKQNLKEKSTLTGANVDWRKWDSPIKNQRTCGSCWAFAVVSAIENQYYKLKGKQTIFSEQYLIDCDGRNRGCRGGWTTGALRWVQFNGLLKEEILEYKNTQEQCERKYKAYEYKIVKGLEYFREGSTSNSVSTWDELLQKGPIIVSVDTKIEGFRFYKPENFDAIIPKKDECKSKDHAVVAVATVYENNQEFIIVRNSWGTFWGYRGYYKIPKNNSCFATQAGLLPIVYDGKVPPEHPPKPKPEPSDCVKTYGGNGFFGEPQEVLCDSTPILKKRHMLGVKLPEVRKSKYPLKIRLFRYNKCMSKGELYEYDLTESTEFPNKNGGLFWSQSIAFIKHTRDNCVSFYKDECLKGDYMFEICEDIPDVKGANLNELQLVNSFVSNPDHVKGITFYLNKNFEGRSYTADLTQPRFNWYPLFYLRWYVKKNRIQSIKLLTK